MFVGAEEIQFNDRAFDYATTRHARAHLHLSGGESTRAQWLIHKEGALDATLGEFFGSLGIGLNASKVQFDAAVHGGRVVTSNVTHGWQLWLDPCDDGRDAWSRSAQFEGFAPRQKDRMMLVFEARAATAASLSDRFAKVPTQAELSNELGPGCA
jgi:hypothetical protein